MFLSPFYPMFLTHYKNNANFKISDSSDRVSTTTVTYDLLTYIVLPNLLKVQRTQTPDMTNVTLRIIML